MKSNISDKGTYLTECLLLCVVTEMHIQMKTKIHTTRN